MQGQACCTCLIDRDKTQHTAQSRKHVSYIESVGSAILYGVCSTSMAFLNKTVISSFNFNYPLFILACQMLLCIISLKVLRLTRIINLQKYTLKLGKAFLWPSLFYAIHSVTALHALAGMSIPMYAAIKRCTPIVTLFLSVALIQKRMPSLCLLLSVISITVGCILAGLGDLKFDPVAYKYGVISVFAQGLYLTLSQKCLLTMSALEVLQINSINTVFIFILLSFCMESNGIAEFNRFSDVAFSLCFVMQTSVGILLNYSLFYCTAKNSALTTSLVGVFKSVFQTVVGFFTFGGVYLNILNVGGLSLNLFGGILYIYLKYKERDTPTAVYGTV